VGKLITNNLFVKMFCWLLSIHAASKGF